MSLLHLPTEVLLIILNSLDQADVFALISTNRELYNVLNDHLYAHNIQHRGGDALIWAATHDNTALVQRFLRKGADPNIRVSSIGNLSFIPRGLYRPEYDFDGWMVAHNPACTHWTVFHPNPEGFYNRREGVHIEDTALEAALSNGNVEVAELLVGLDGVDVEKGIPSHLMPLNLAVRWEMEDVVRLLLEHRNVAVNAKDSENRTALHWAALDGHTRIVELILAREDVRIDVQDGNRWTALILAAMEGHTRIVELLLARRNIDIHMAGLNGQTALHCAIRQGHDQIAELLLARDELDINLTDDQGCIALHLAAAHGHEAIVKLILDHPNVRGVQTN
ncbi:hypothetical protein MW887_005655 [Aspergillus wentii]|nr:hypothetical protein MW887_005655 [Aspergillus wentii]